MYKYLKFRFFQFFRCFNHDISNLNYLFITIVILLFTDFNPSYYYLIILLLSFLLFHSRRKDLIFLKKIYPFSWFYLIFVEYFLLYSIGIFLIRKFDYNHFYVASIAALFLIVIAPIKNKVRYIALNFIPDYLFEIKSYIRRNPLFSLIMYFTFFVSAYHPFTFILLLTFSFEYISNIYSINEPKEIYILQFRKITLINKIKSNVIFFHVALMPVYITYLIINHDNFEYLLWFMMVLQTFVVERILYKYEGYNPKEKEKYLFAGNVIFFTLKSLLIIPLLFDLKQRIRVSNRKIKKYVGNC